MAVNRYIGMRYVPKIIGQHDPQIAYEALSIVTYNGNSYTSKQNVPPGTEITNTDYWVVTGNYNAQVEQYRTEVVNAVATVTSAMSDLESAVGQDIDNMEADVTTEMTNTVSRVNQNLVDSKLSAMTVTVNNKMTETEEYVDNRVETALPNILLLDAGGGDVSGRATLKTCICKPTITILNNEYQQRAYATVNIPQSQETGHQYFLRSGCVNWNSITQGESTIGPKCFVPSSAQFVTVEGTQYLQVVLDATNFASETTNINYWACIDYIDVAPSQS